ncbi:hypothetical protein [Winogradskyella sp.]|uniref:hypothetical protein n=1 Tax=Winogradskyella sp. TaxID=1883156 RepID=UPI002629408A|nr:hypothetical protein [Winogradskyella sp.]
MTETKINEFLSAFENKTFEGYSVYDAFNSPFLKEIGKLEIKLINVIITQLFKRTPFNIRGLFGVKKSINPKALGLILKANLILLKPQDELRSLYELILSKRSNELDNLSWGYNWDYYTLRGGTFPKDFPNAIVTYFIGDALLDYYKIYPSAELKKNLLSIRKYFLEDINRTERGNGICFSYSSVDHKEIYNASALISRYLFRMSEIFGTNDKEILIKSTNYLKNAQNADGSWYYGYASNQKWVDSFHTQYILEYFECLSEGFIHEMDLKDLIDKGRTYYLTEFYYDNVCNYYAKRKYPINIHSIANRVIYLIHNKQTNQATEIVDWTFNNLYNFKNHCFYFEKNKYYVNKNVYHRWNQSWMYLALSLYKSNVVNEV